MDILVWLPHSIRAFAVRPEQLERLRARHPNHRFRAVEEEADFLAELASADAALVWRFSAGWYDLGPKLRLVATPAAGRELVAPDPQGRARTAHGHFHGKIMAETLLGMLLFFSRRLGAAAFDREARRYDRDAFSPTRRLAGQEALIVGYGSLGRECARLLKAFGLRVVGMKRNASVEAAPADRVVSVAELHGWLPRTDHVVLTLPGGTGTDHVISTRELALLRPTAGLYNLGRGNAVDETALVRALESRELAHAFLDVFEREPLPADSPLWSAPNLALLPHASAICAEYLDLWFEELDEELGAGPLEP